MAYSIGEGGSTSIAKRASMGSKTSIAPFKKKAAVKKTVTVKPKAVPKGLTRAPGILKKTPAMPPGQAKRPIAKPAPITPPTGRPIKPVAKSPVSRPVMEPEPFRKLPVAPSLPPGEFALSRVSGTAVPDKAAKKARKK